MTRLTIDPPFAQSSHADLVIRFRLDSDTVTEGNLRFVFSEVRFAAHLTLQDELRKHFASVLRHVKSPAEFFDVPVEAFLLGQERGWIPRDVEFTTADMSLDHWRKFADLVTLRPGLFEESMEIYLRNFKTSSTEWELVAIVIAVSSPLLDWLFDKTVRPPLDLVFTHLKDSLGKKAGQLRLRKTTTDFKLPKVGHAELVKRDQGEEKTEDDFDFLVGYA